VRRALATIALLLAAVPALGGNDGQMLQTLDPAARSAQPLVFSATGADALASRMPLTQRVLDIAWRHQAHALSCEAAALEMALSYFGVRQDELTLMGLMGYDRRPARFDARGRLIAWGDPNSAYVGNPDGSIYRYTGYGVYFAPVARAAAASGVHVLAAGSGLYGTGVSPQALYGAVLEGHPAVVWISNTYHRVALSSYIAYDGRQVWYTLTEHAVTLIGVRPGAVLIDDPWFGRAWHTKAEFESAYATFSQMAVVLG
jgi:uncharacterized protein YvpB